MSLSDTCNSSLEDWNWKEDIREASIENIGIMDCVETLLTLSKIQQPVEILKKRKYEPKPEQNLEIRYCQVCNKSNTPLWRRTKEYHTLCNACGISEKTKNKSKTNGFLQVMTRNSGNVFS